MHEWHSTPAEDALTFDLRIELDIDNDGVADSHSNVVSVLVDNSPPLASLDIDLGAGVECADFAPGATFTGHYTATDTYFGSFSFDIQPTGPAHGVLPTPPSGTSVFFGGAIGDPGVVGAVYSINTGASGGKGPMDPCGFALILHVSDRTNVNSGGGHHHAQDAVGFCLQVGHP